MSQKGMRAGVKGKNVTSRQKDRITRRLQLLGPDDQYTPQAVRDQIDYLTGILKGKGAAGREGYKEGGSVKKNLKAVPEGNKGLKKLPTEVRNKMGFMKKGGEVDPTKFTGTLKGNFKRLAGNAIQSLHNMTFPKEEREKLQKIQKDDLDKYYLDKEKKRKKRKAGKEMKKTVLQVIGKKQGGLVKGGTSSQMTGKEFKGIF